MIFLGQLEHKIATFSVKDKVIIGGDFNARTATLPDAVSEDEDDYTYQNFPERYKISLLKERNNRDKIKNEYGEYLTELCSATNLRILNGRTLGDLYGEFTFYGKHGYSTVDYILASQNLIKEKQIQYMKVQPITFLSDHRPLLLKINSQNTHAPHKGQKIPLHNRPEKFFIKDMNYFKNEIETMFSEQKRNEIISEINASNQSPNSIHEIVNKIENIFIETATKCRKINKQPRKKQTNTNTQNEHKPWYNKDCKILKRQLNTLSKSLSTNPNKAYTRRPIFFKEKTIQT